MRRLITPVTPDIREIEDSDVPGVCAIYNHYIEFSPATFEETVITPEEMGRRVAAVTKEYPFLVAEQDDELLGYAYASRWKDRAAYGTTAETTIYLSKDVTGHGVGTALYDRLLDELRIRKYHVAIGIISLPNDASVKLHESQGFRQAGLFHQVGRKFNRWIDVGYWELKL
jgi:L-amino acid N-acyltransferase YncA